MAISRYYTDTCTIQRPTRTQSATGDVQEAYTDMVTSSPGRLTMVSQIETGQTSDQLDSTYVWYFSPGVDIRATDRLTNIRRNDGSYVQGQPDLNGDTENAVFRVESITDRGGRRNLNHRMATLKVFE